MTDKQGSLEILLEVNNNKQMSMQCIELTFPLKLMG